MPNFIIRKAAEDDSSAILRFIKDLAEYEELSHAVEATEESIREQLFCAHPVAYVLIAEIDSLPVGMALYFLNFSTFKSKTGIYIEDLYVDPEFRGLGIGKAFFKEIAQIALRNDYGRINWSVLNWNKPSIDFYLSLGAEPQTEWQVHKLEGDAIKALVECKVS